MVDKITLELLKQASELLDAQGIPENNRMAMHVNKEGESVTSMINSTASNVAEMRENLLKEQFHKIGVNPFDAKQKGMFRSISMVHGNRKDYYWGEVLLLREELRIHNRKLGCVFQVPQ